jgi:hypothetical protein
LLVLDVLKPHQPSLPSFASNLSEFKGLTKVDVSLVEINANTASLRVSLYGSGLDYNGLKEHMGKQSAVIHSVDRVIIEK